MYIWSSNIFYFLLKKIVLFFNFVLAQSITKHEVKNLLNYMYVKWVLFKTSYGGICASDIVLS